MAGVADRRMITSYLDGRTYYWLKETGRVDNPDQRIAEDVRAFTTTTLSFTLIFLNGTFTVVAFSGVLWTISRLLFGVAVGYAALGSLLTILLGRPLVGLNYRQSRSRGQLPDGADPRPRTRRVGRAAALGGTG